MCSCVRVCARVLARACVRVTSRLACVCMCVCVGGELPRSSPSHTPGPAAALPRPLPMASAFQPQLSILYPRRQPDKTETRNPADGVIMIIIQFITNARLMSCVASTVAARAAGFFAPRSAAARSVASIHRGAVARASRLSRHVRHGLAHPLIETCSSGG